MDQTGRWLLESDRERMDAANRSHAPIDSNGMDARDVIRSEWLGHADPAFTLRTYVHLLDEGVGGCRLLRLRRS